MQTLSVTIRFLVTLQGRAIDKGSREVRCISSHHGAQGGAHEISTRLNFYQKGNIDSTTQRGALQHSENASSSLTFILLIQVITSSLLFSSLLFPSLIFFSYSTPPLKYFTIHQQVHARTPYLQSPVLFRQLTHPCSLPCNTNCCGPPSPCLSR